MIIIRYFKKILSNVNKEYRKKIYFALSIQCVLAITVILSTFLYTYYVNNVVYDKKISETQYVIIAFLVIFLVETLFTGIHKIYGCKIFDNIAIALRMKLFNTITLLPQNEIEYQGVGELKRLINDDVTYIETFFTSKMDYFINIVKIIVYTIIMLRINIELTVFGVITIPIYIIITKYLTKKTAEVEDKNREINQKYDRWLYNDYKGWRDIKTLRCEEMQEAKFDEYWEQRFKMFNKIFVYNFLNRSMVTVKNFLILYVGSYAYAGYMVITGRIEIITLILFIQYFTLFMNLYDTNSNMIINAGRESIHIDKILEQINRRFTVGGRKCTVEKIEVDNVTFKYDNSDQIVLNNINLSFPIVPGKTVIVGPSGCGKSTLLKLILGLYNPCLGEIKVDGQQLNEYLTRDFYSKVGCILQDSQLFPFSIRDNLKMGNMDISDEEMKQVCSSVNILEFIESLPEQFDTILGENSVNISGGQKQKLLYARLIIQNPKVIILDESTSMIDAKGCRILQQNIENLWRDKTIIQVSHKLEEITDADRIILIKDGKVMEEGQHTWFYEHNLVYRNMFCEQVTEG